MRKSDLVRQIGTAEPARPLLHPSMAEIYRGKVADLHPALQDETLGAEAVGIIRSLIDEIVLTRSTAGSASTSKATSPAS